jgi:hypothetical protein
VKLCKGPPHVSNPLTARLTHCTAATSLGMPSLTSFPVELLDGVCSELSLSWILRSPTSPKSVITIFGRCSDLARFRASEVCRFTNIITEPRVFLHLMLDIAKVGYPDPQSQLHALATKQTRSSSIWIYARSLEIRPFDGCLLGTQNDEEKASASIPYLSRALLSLQCLR